MLLNCFEVQNIERNDLRLLTNKIKHIKYFALFCSNDYNYQLQNSNFSHVYQKLM